MTTIRERRYLRISLLALLLLAFAGGAAVSTAGAQTAAPPRQSGHRYANPILPGANPILPGDHPDPTIVRIGGTYWTTSTSGDWAPEFVVYRSTDLKRWTAAGAVFPRTPEWASGDFWAPEMVVDHDRIVVYYAARKRGGPLCVAAATAGQPVGPYTDHGPIVCQADGSIDPSMVRNEPAVRDKEGVPYLIWKEDGNSIGKPTPIWAQPLTSDLLHLTGSKTQLIANDPGTWEGGVVEAPYILRHGDRFYLFYAGNACCGVGCHYAEGVARADHLLGPWTKDPANPIIAANVAWKCPGHGTAVQTPDGRDFFLYHAYPAAGTVYLGRESVLDRITWSADGWPVVNGGRGPSGGAASAPSAQPSFFDDFRGGELSPEWKWPIGHRPEWQLRGGRLDIRGAGKDDPAMLARPILGASFMVTAGVDTGIANTRSTAAAGLGIVGEVGRGVVLFRQSDRLVLSVLNKAALTNGERQNLWQTSVSPSAGSSSGVNSSGVNTSGIVWLRAISEDGRNVAFSYSLDRQQWLPAGPVRDVTEILAWDQGLRVALISDGETDDAASFTQFALEPARNSGR